MNTTKVWITFTLSPADPTAGLKTYVIPQEVDVSDSGYLTDGVMKCYRMIPTHDFGTHYWSADNDETRYAEQLRRALRTDQKTDSYN